MTQSENGGHVEHEGLLAGGSASEPEAAATKPHKQYKLSGNPDVHCATIVGHDLTKKPLYCAFIPKPDSQFCECCEPEK